jgi:hypothetical protein
MENMLTITLTEIDQYRSRLTEYPAALQALQAIAECEGDLEDAAIALAIAIGQQPDRSDWLEGLAKRCRVAVCSADCQRALKEQDIVSGVAQLTEVNICPPVLVLPVILYVWKIGIEEFCQPLSLKIN